MNKDHRAKGQYQGRLRSSLAFPIKKTKETQLINKDGSANELRQVRVHSFVSSAAKNGKKAGPMNKDHRLEE